MIKGYDWSGYQGPHPSTTGGAFFIIKATQGTGYTNPDLHTQFLTAQAATGSAIGFYHFAEPGNTTAQVDHFLATVQPLLVPEHTLWWDWEARGSTSAEKDQALERIKGARPRTMVGLYCNTDFWHNVDTSSKCGDGLWIADPSAAAGHPRINHPWLIHQYGITRDNVDLNVAEFDDAAHMRAWASGGAPNPAPPPVVPPKKPVAFPGASFFHAGEKSPVVAAMHDRLVAEGCNRYTSQSGKDTWGPGDSASYAAWQRKLGYRGADADGMPGPSSWAALGVMM